MLCPGTQSIHSGKGLFLKSEGYKTFVRKDTGFHCNCSISADNQAKVSVYAVDLRMCDKPSSKCGQLFEISGSNTNVSPISTTPNDVYVAFKRLSPAAKHLSLRFTQTDGKVPFYVWLYFYAEGKNNI